MAHTSSSPTPSHKLHLPEAPLPRENHSLSAFNLLPQHPSLKGPQDASPAQRDTVCSSYSLLKLEEVTEQEALEGKKKGGLEGGELVRVTFSGNPEPWQGGAITVGRS